MNGALKRVAVGDTVSTIDGRKGVVKAVTDECGTVINFYAELPLLYEKGTRLIHYYRSWDNSTFTCAFPKLKLTHMNEVELDQ